MANKDSNQPVEKYSLRGVNVSIFENQAQNGAKFYKVNILRSYMDEGKFKSTSNFGRDDLPIIANLAQRAWQDVLEREANAKKKETA